jgi:hypothetical protein
MMNLSAWRRIAARQTRYRSLLRERVRVLLPLMGTSRKDARKVRDFVKLIVRVQRHQKRMDLNESKCAAIFRAIEGIE